MLKKMYYWLRHYKMPLLSGVMIGTTFIPFPPWAALFGFVPLWSFLKYHTSLRETVIGGLVTSFTLTLIGFYWVGYTASEFGNLPAVVGFFLMLLFAIVGTYYIPLCCFIWKKWFDPLNLPWFPAWLSIAAVFALGEKLYVTLFPWNFGYVWAWVDFPIAQTAEIWGIDGISTITIFYSAAFGLLLDMWKAKDQKVPKFAAVIVASFVLLNVLGYILKPDLSNETRKARVLVVQGNVGNLAKERAERGFAYRDEIIGKYIRLTNQGVSQHRGKKIDFVVWPETATPLRMGPGHQNLPKQQRVIRFAQQLGVPLVTGAYHSDPGSDDTSNSLFVIEPSGRVQQPYKKSHLLAFGEYTPILWRFPELEAKMGLASFARGNGPESKMVNGISIGPQICYESLFPSFSKGLSEAGAELFVNLTNDSWFGPFSEPFQNMSMTLSRALEFRRPIIRSTNTGFTTAIDAAGTQYQRSEWFTEQVLLFEIPLASEKKVTLFQKFPYLAEFFIGIVFLFILFQHLQPKRTET